MATSQEYTISRKVSDTEEEIIQIPYGTLANKPDLSVYQTKTDNALETNSKTVVGAINEVVTGIAETLESFGMSLAPQENGKLNKKVYVYPDGYLSQGTSYDASKDLYLSIGDGLTLETIDEANNIWNIKSGSAITSVDGLGGGAISGDVSTSGNLTVGCNLTVNGTTTTVDSTTLQVKDKLIEVAHGNTTALTTPAGLVAPKYDGTNSGALVFDSTGTAYVGDVKLDSTGNIDVAKSELQPLATRTGLVGGNLVQYDSTELTLKDSGKKISDLALKTDLSGKANLAGGNTFSGVQTINAPTNVSGSEQTTMKVKTSNGGAIIFGKEGANSGTMIRLDQTDGTCRLRFRSSATAGAMVWEQPESGAQLYVDLGARDGDYHRVQFPSSAGTLALTSQIPDVSGKANLNGGNTFTGKQLFNNTVGGVTNQLALNETQWDIFTCRDLTTPSMKTAIGKGYVWCQDSDAIYSQFKATGIYYGNDTSGYDGTLKFPTNISGEKTIATTDQIQTVNNGTLTIQQNGNTVATFTANQSGNSTADIEVPTALSELTNDIKAITNNTDKTNSWAFAGGGNTVVANSTANSCVAIGSGSQTRYEKSIRIGTALGQTPTSQSVTQIGVNNYTSSGRALYLGAGYTGFTYMNAAGSSWSSASDIRDKTDIQTIDHALDFIKKLKPITYVMNDRERYLIRDEDDNPILDENGKQQYDVEAHKRGDKKKHRRFAGLSAQDTYQAMLDCYNNDTNYAQIVDNNKFDHPDDEYLEQYSMSYERLVPFLIKAIQEQQEQIEKLKSKLGE